jgi:hypothetical protein
MPDYQFVIFDGWTHYFKVTRQAMYVELNIVMPSRNLCCSGYSVIPCPFPSDSEVIN